MFDPFFRSFSQIDTEVSYGVQNDLYLKLIYEHIQIAIHLTYKNVVKIQLKIQRIYDQIRKHIHKTNLINKFYSEYFDTILFTLISEID